MGSAHRISNEHSEDLVIIEVQHGAYTGEDDICRLADDYGRHEAEVGDHAQRERPPEQRSGGRSWSGGSVGTGSQLALLIIPAPTVTPVASSIRMNDPVVRFFE